MQAVVLERPGGPEALVYVTTPDPVPGAGKVLVELRAAAVNRRDALVRSAAGPAYVFPLPLILGSDGAGVRRDTGEDVVILPGLHWGPSEAVAGPDFRIVGGPGDGTYAELIAVPQANVFPRPPASRGRRRRRCPWRRSRPTARCSPLGSCAVGSAR